MRLRDRLERLEVKRNTKPGVLFLTAEGLKDVQGKLTKVETLQGVKIIAGIDPKNI